MGLSHNVTLSTKDYAGLQYTISDCYNVRYSNHYGPEGGGFGFLSFSLKRRYGVNYTDIGFGYRVTLVKGMKIFLFYGFITKIEETNADEFTVYALGANSLTSFDIVNFIMADNRVNRWVTACNPRGSYRPDKFDHSLSWTEVINEGTDDETQVSYNGLEIKPRRGVEYSVEDYYYIRYRFEFGEVARRLTGLYKVALPNNWPGKIKILDGSANVLWSADVSGNGVLNVDLDSLVSDSFVEIRFEVTTAGLNTSEDGTVYFRLWDTKVASVDSAIDASSVAKIVAAHMAAHYGFSNDTSLIHTIGFEIPQAAYDADKPLNEIMNEACSYGGPGLEPLAWGTSFDDNPRMYLEVQDLSTVGYVVEQAESISVSGDWAESYQKAYGKYTDIYGQDKRTATFSALPQISALGGLYRKQIVDLKEVTPSQAEQVVMLALQENREPKITTDFSIKDSVQLTTGGNVPVSEIRAGRIVQVPQMRAKEASILEDKRKGFNSFMLIMVEVDLDSNECTLTPADSISSFELYMEKLQRLAK